MLGTLTINGKEDSMTLYRTVFGFVPQEDIMHRSLTVKEILEYVVLLFLFVSPVSRFNTATRLPPHMTKAERSALVSQQSLSHDAP